MPRNGRLGLQAYARILAEITGTPKTPAQAADAMGIGKQSMREILWRMEHMKLAHVVGWVEPELKRGFLAPLFAAGNGESLPYPRPLRRQAPGATLARSNPKPELMAFAHVCRCLQAGMTRSEIHAETGVAQMRIRLLLREMRRLKLAHRCGWIGREDGAGSPAEVLKFGRGTDAPRPRILTDKERQERHRKRKRAKQISASVARAIAGQGALPKFGVQQFHLIGAGAAG